MAAFETNPFEELIIKITSLKNPFNFNEKIYPQSVRTFVYKDDEEQNFIKSHLKNNISTDPEIDLNFIIEKYNNGDYNLNSERKITREHVDAYLKKYNYNNSKRIHGRITSGGNPKSNKKRKTNKRKKSKTNKRRKTKSKTNKRKKRTRRRR